MRIEYRVHTFDRYNWDKGKQVSIGPITVKDEELAKLHRAGLAREYEVGGSSDPSSVETDLPGQPGAPPPEVELPPDAEGREGREGGRGDPGRERN